MYLAGLDVGTTRTRLVVFNEDLTVFKSKTVSSPAHYSKGLLVLHDSLKLRELVRSLAYSVTGYVRGLGLATYRASVLAWKSVAEPVTDVILWSNMEYRMKAVKNLPLMARLARALPVYKSILAPSSPLPLLSYLSKKQGPSTRVWTVEAFLSEALGTGYASDEASSALSGLFKPHDLKPIPLARRLAGLPSWFELPRITPMTLDTAGVLRAISPDQQAALIGLSCTAPGCVMINLGTGGFVQAVSTKVPRVPRGGLIPIVTYSDGRRRTLGLEAHSLGLGIAVNTLVEELGGFEVVHGLGPGTCVEEWRGALVRFYPGGVGRYLSPPASKIDAACGLVVSVALEAARLVWKLPLTPREYWLTGGLSRIPLLRRVLSLLLPSGGDLKYYGGEATARGAALLAGVSLGLYNSPSDAPGPEYHEVERECWDGVHAADDILAWQDAHRDGDGTVLSALYSSLKSRLDCLAGLG